MAKKNPNGLLEKDNPAFTGIEYADELLNFAAAMIKAEEIPDDIKPPVGWIEKHLIKDGAIVYCDGVRYPLPRGFYIYAGTAKGTPRRYDEPEFIKAKGGENTVAVVVPSEAVTVLYANASRVALYSKMQAYGSELARIRLAEMANVKASMQQPLLAVEDEKLRTTVERMFENTYNGNPTVIKAEAMNAIRELFTPAVNYHAGELHALFTTVRSDALKQYGGITPNQYKAERTQSAEVSANIAESIDNVYIMIDNVNETAERNNVPLRLVYRGFGARYDEDAVPSRNFTAEAPDETEESEATEE